MRTAFVFLLFIVSLVIQLEPYQAIARGPQTHRDSVAIRQRNKAFADFKRRVVTIPKYRVKCNYFYAEEVLYNRYGIKADMHAFESFCGTGMEEAWFADSCYESVIDSMMFVNFGKNIYQRLEVAGDSLEKIYPDRYQKDEYGLGCYKPLFDDDSVHQRLIRNMKYPSTAKRDSVQGIVYVWIDYDSLGNIVGSSVFKSVRPDLDSAAMAGALQIGKVNPNFRWGRCLPGKFVLPIKFALTE